MIHKPKLALLLREPLPPQHALPLRLHLPKLKLEQYPRDCQSKLNVRNALPNAPARADRERRECASGGFDGVFGGAV